MIIVGERVNTSRQEIKAAVENRDENYIQSDVSGQYQAGADYIDINAGISSGKEIEDLEWLINVIQEEIDCPLCIDSADSSVLEKAFAMVNKPPMINSISLEAKRLYPMLEFLKGKKCRVVALCVSDGGLPKSAEEIVERAEIFVQRLAGIGIKHDDIFIDPIIQPVCTDVTKGKMIVNSIMKIKDIFPNIHIICGLSNVSYGLPERKSINRTFLTMMMSAGLDSVILDPLDKRIMSTYRTTKMLLGDDPYCRNFIKAVRDGNYIPG